MSPAAPLHSNAKPNIGTKNVVLHPAPACSDAQWQCLPIRLLIGELGLSKYTAHSYESKSIFLSKG